MIFTVTKQEVVEALRTEPLRNGSWVHWGSSDSRTFKNNTGCAVCAIGGILDTKLGTICSPEELDIIGVNLVKIPSPDSIGNWTYDYSSHDGHSIVPYSVLMVEVNRIVKGKHKLSALSLLFEGLMGHKKYQTRKGMANRKCREIMVKFVKKNFPAKLNIDTDKEY